MPDLMETISLERQDLQEIPGIVPPINHFGRDECLFAPRCNFVEDSCLKQRPLDFERAKDPLTACWAENTKNQKVFA